MPPAEAPKPKKRKFRRIDLTVDVDRSGVLKGPQLVEACELEAKMGQQDRIIRETAEARNDLESYCYKMRDAMDTDLKEYVNDADKEAFKGKLQAMDDWIYSDEGFEANKKTFVEKMAELRETGDKIEARSAEAAERPAAAAELLGLVERYKAIGSSTDEKYEHLSKEDREKLTSESSAKEGWLQAELDKQAALPSHTDPCITAAQIRAEMNGLKVSCEATATKPKPAPEPEAPAADADGKASEAGDAKASEAGDDAAAADGKASEAGDDAAAADGKASEAGDAAAADTEDAPAKEEEPKPMDVE